MEIGRRKSDAREIVDYNREIVAHDRDIDGNSRIARSWLIHCVIVATIASH